MNNEIRLRKFTREKANQFRDIFLRRELIHFEWLGKNWEILIASLKCARENLSEVGIDWGGASACFRFDEAWLSQITESIFGTNDFGQLQEPWRMIVIEAAFAQLATDVERFTRKRFVLKDEAQSNEETSWEKFSIQFFANGLNTDAEIWLDQLGVSFLSTSLRACTFAVVDWELWAELPIRARFVVGATQIMIHELRQIDLTDVILFDECMTNLNLDKVVVEFGDKFISVGKVRENKIELFSYPERLMDEINETELNRIEAYGDLSIKLSFDLGERSVRLSDLTKICPGYIFDLGRDLRREVFMRANGKIIGEGELVEIDGQIGVSILRLAPSASSTIE